MVVIYCLAVRGGSRKQGAYVGMQRRSLLYVERGRGDANHDQRREAEGSLRVFAFDRRVCKPEIHTWISYQANKVGVSEGVDGRKRVDHTSKFAICTSIIDMYLWLN